MNNMEKKREQSYIPAQPGYSTVELLELADNDFQTVGYEIHLRPIIGWELTRDPHVTEDALIVSPITLEGVDRENPVVYPDGRVEHSYVYTWASVEEWAESEQERKKQAAEAATTKK